MPLQISQRLVMIEMVSLSVLRNDIDVSYLGGRNGQCVEDDVLEGLLGCLWAGLSGKGKGVKPRGSRCCVVGGVIGNAPKGEQSPRRLASE